MEFIKIKTPLNVNVNVRHAGAGRRLLAFLIDQFVIFLYLWLIIYVMADILSFDFNLFNYFDEDFFDYQAFLEIIFTILMFPAFFYSLWTEMLFNGQTIGKMVMGTRVVKIDGYKAGFPEYFTRWSFRFIDFWTGMFLLLFMIPVVGEEAAYIMAMLLMFLSGLVAFIFVINTNNAQRLGDIVAGTTVLKLKEKESINITILEDIVDAYIPKYEQVVRLTDNDARIIKDTFIRAKKSRDHRTIKKLREKLESVMDIQTSQSDADFIDTVMKDFNYYTQKM